MVAIARCGCAGFTGCACLVAVKGALSITGSGGASNQYVIDGPHLAGNPTSPLDVVVAGTGTEASPWLISVEGEQYGTGSPEGVVTAPVGTYYTDTAITNGAMRWAKKTGTGNTGWVCTEGDTGTRDLSAFINAPATGTVFQVSRSGRMVYLTAYISFSSTAWTPGDVLFTLPDGFRPVTYHYTSPPYSGPGVLSLEPSGSAALWSDNVSTTTAWSFAYMTPAAWPSTLPGVAV